MIFIGTLGSLASGAAFPVMMIFFTNIIDKFTGFEKELNLCSLQEYSN